jgi:protein-S-isoprenylcysteine O-methyltransferase Ste14
MLGRYLLLAALLLVFAFVVFRLIVRRAYATRGRLHLLASGLQLAVLVGYFSFPYVYNPPEWAYFWQVGTSSSPGSYLAGLVVICAGFLVAFGTMAWFGLGRAFGIYTDELKTAGPYKLSRNPQVIGGYLLAMGPTLQRSSLYALGWIVMYAVITHWMVMTEEEHLLRVYGDTYEAYCSRVPRYFPACRR